MNVSQLQTIFLNTLLTPSAPRCLTPWFSGNPGRWNLIISLLPGYIVGQLLVINGVMGHPYKWPKINGVSLLFFVHPTSLGVITGRLAPPGNLHWHDFADEIYPTSGKKTTLYHTHTHEVEVPTDDVKNAVFDLKLDDTKSLWKKHTLPEI